jgi:hypothetical protein
MSRTWRRVIDTSMPSPEAICKVVKEPFILFQDYRINARSVVVLRRATI